MVSLLLVKIVHDSNIRQPDSQKISIQYLCWTAPRDDKGELNLTQVLITEQEEFKSVTERCSKAQ